MKKYLYFYLLHYNKLFVLVFLCLSLLILPFNYSICEYIITELEGEEESSTSSSSSSNSTTPSSSEESPWKGLIMAVGVTLLLAAMVYWEVGMGGDTSPAPIAPAPIAPAPIAPAPIAPAPIEPHPLADIFPELNSSQQTQQGPKGPRKYQPLMTKEMVFGMLGIIVGYVVIDFFFPK
jgi:hypothetical protein